MGEVGTVIMTLFSFTTVPVLTVRRALLVEEEKYDDDDDESLPPPRLIFTKFADADDTREDKGRAKATTDGDIDTVSNAAMAATAVRRTIVIVVSSRTSRTPTDIHDTPIGTPLI